MPNQEIVTVLTMIKQKYERKDYCLECFSQIKLTLIEDHNLSYWKVRIGEKPQKEKFKKTEDFLNLLRAPDIDPGMHYLLSLFLERQKVLQRQKSQGETLIFEWLENGEIFVTKPAPITQSMLLEFTKA